MKSTNQKNVFYYVVIRDEQGVDLDDFFRRTNHYNGLRLKLTEEEYNSFPIYSFIRLGLTVTIQKAELDPLL